MDQENSPWPLTWGAEMGTPASPHPGESSRLAGSGDCSDSALGHFAEAAKFGGERGAELP